ncbi:hypothetical protein pb186bvf_000044 [Paramecium bursaria]
MNNCCYCLHIEMRVDSVDQQRYQKVSLHQRLTYSLYEKYAESQNYYYTKDINEIMLDQTTQSNIQFKDQCMIDEEQEYIKKYYAYYQQKMQVLSEFYKFHKDLPRWSVQQSIVNLLNEYYNQKRKIEYYKIQKLIEQENRQNPDKPAKGIVGDKPIESQSTPCSNTEQSVVDVDNILADIKDTIEKKNDSEDKQPTVQKFYRNDQKLKTERESDPIMMANSFHNQERIQALHKIVKKQRLQIQVPEVIFEHKTKHQVILEQLHQRVQEKIKLKKLLTAGTKREVKSVHFDNQFKKPKTPKAKTSKTLKLSTHISSSSKKMLTGCQSSRGPGTAKYDTKEQIKQKLNTNIGTKLVFRKYSKSQQKKQCQTLTTPRHIQR